ncbi:MAG TPA: YncE family protein, partial [Vicinamibacterales bacterium]|nr:YncE family protein [Vicinamibacterales bacterium]
MPIRRSFRPLVWSSLLVVSLVATGFALSRAPIVGVQPDGTILTPVGQRLTPAGTQIEVDDRPLGMALSPNHQLLAVVTGSNFASRALHLIDVSTGTLNQTISINNSFVGVGFSPSGNKIYVGGGTNDVKVFSLTAGGTYAAAVPPTIPVTPGSPAPSGLSVSPDGTRVYVALNQANAVAVIDTATSAVVTRVAVGTYPYTTVVSADGSKVYVTNWGGKIPTASDFTDGMNPVVVDRRTGIPVSGTVSVIDTASNHLLKTIDVGLHPTGMALSPRGDRVYVTNANSDTVSVIDTFRDAVVKTLSVGGVGPGAGPGEGPGNGHGPASAALLGASPNAVAVSPDGRTLYVANASQNAVAVVDVNGPANDAVRGLIPTGWYPTVVALNATGDELFIGNGYGFGSIAPATRPGTGRSYTDRVGVVSIVNVPNDKQLRDYTKQVRDNDQSTPPALDSKWVTNGDNGGPGGHGHDGPESPNASGPIPKHLGDKSPIKHVFYIIKENRTYDQVLGDVKKGNGDPRLVMFGAEVSPNHHKLAEEFVLLDNLYCNGQVSRDGHPWSTMAYNTDYI